MRIKFPPKHTITVLHRVFKNEEAYTRESDYVEQLIRLNHITLNDRTDTFMSNAIPNLDIVEYRRVLAYMRLNTHIQIPSAMSGNITLYNNYLAAYLTDAVQQIFNSTKVVIYAKVPEKLQGFDYIFNAGKYRVFRRRRVTRTITTHNRSRRYKSISSR